MGNLRRYYYANKAKIWKTILIIASILLLIQIVNYVKKIEHEQALENSVSNNTNTTNSITDNTVLTTDKSAMTGTTRNETAMKEEIAIIEQFVEYCNNKQFEQAYLLLSEECKKNLFKTNDSFKKNYADVIFSSYKTCTAENWNGETYKVRLSEDALATGNTSKDMSIQEYMTIVENNGEKKLNINNYIGRKEINKTNTENDITIEVISKDTFYEYEIYNISVKNGTDKTIYLDNGENGSTMYIEDSNGVQYEAANSEIIYNTLKIPAGTSMKYSIKYVNTYRVDRDIQSLTFEKVILDYDEYIKDSSSYEDTIKLKINF